MGEPENRIWLLETPSLCEMREGGVMKKFFLLLYFILVSLLYAQQVSTKAEIAIFKNYSSDMPSYFSSDVFDLVTDLVTSMKRFEVFSFSASNSTMDLDAFVKAIADGKKNNVLLPDSILSGKEALTKEYWDRLINSYYVLVVSVHNFSAKRTLSSSSDDGVLSMLQGLMGGQVHIKSSADTLWEIFGDGYDLTPAELAEQCHYKNYDLNPYNFCVNDFTFSQIAYSTDTQLDFEYSIATSVTVSVLDVKNGIVSKTIRIDSDGTGHSAGVALTSCLNTAAAVLKKDLASVDAFKIKTGITEINNRTVTLELGKNYGIKVGHEFAPVDFSTYEDKTVDSEVGLLLITEVDENSSTAKILYADKPLSFGQQVYEIPRMFFELTVFGNANLLFKSATVPRNSNIGLGIQATVTEGLVRFRPTLGFQLDISTAKQPLGYRCFFGCQLFNMFIGRLQISPELRMSVKAIFSTNMKKAVFAGVGCEARIGFSWLVSRDIKLGCACGFGATIGTKESGAQAMFEISTTFKF